MQRASFKDNISLSLPLYIQYIYLDIFGHNNEKNVCQDIRLTRYKHHIIAERTATKVVGGFSCLLRSLVL